jgi:hypothetical protein
MQCIVELLNEIIPMTPSDFAQRVGLEDTTAAYYQRMDFDNWLRQCVTPTRQFTSLNEAYGEYIKSFG